MRKSKTIYASAIALGLCLAVPPAMAQQDQDQQDQGDHHGNNNNGGHGGHHDANDNHGGHDGGNDNHGGGHDNDHGGNGGGNDNAHHGDNDHHGGNGGGGNDNHHGNNDNHNDRNVDVHRNVTVHRNVHIDKTVRERIMRRPDVVKIRANIRAPHRFHWNVYVHPAGWYTHRWVFNEVLPPAFFVSTYWITDFGSFGLIAPPEGLVWVRFDNDALLIDRETGLVVRVVYDVFY